MVGKLIPLLLGILISQEMATHTQSRVHSLPTGLLPPPPPPPEKGVHDEGPEDRIGAGTLDPVHRV